MLFLNKFLPIFVLPIGVVTLLVILAMARKKWWPAVAALAVLYVSSLPVVAGRLMGWLESGYPAVPVAQVRAAVAVVVLGGILGPRVETGYMPNWLDTSERFEAGVALVQAGKAGRLVFTGAVMSWEDRTTTEGDELKRLAVARGVAAESIFVAREIDNTAGEARAVAELMKAQGWNRVILVTTGWHMRRSAYLFKRAGVAFLPFPVDFRLDRGRSVTAIDFLPRGEAWMMTETTLREIYGNLFYRVFR